MDGKVELGMQEKKRCGSIGEDENLFSDGKEDEDVFIWGLVFALITKCPCNYESLANFPHIYKKKNLLLIL